MHDDEHPEPHLKTVIATSEADLIPVIKSVLRGAGIDYVADGEAMMNILPMDVLGPTLHGPRGELRFMVAEDDFAAATALFAEHPDLPTDDAAMNDAAISDDAAGDDDG